MQTFIILGVQRSGTTLLSGMLNNHSKIYIPAVPFAPFVANLYYNLKYEYLSDNNLLKQNAFERFKVELEARRSSKDYINMLNPEKSMRENLLHICREMVAENGKDIYGDKYLDDKDNIFKLTTLHPNAQFIYLIRDGRAVAKSMRDRAYLDMYVSMNNWKREIVKMKILREILPKDRFMEIRYEDILQEPEKAIHQICDFLNIQYEPTMIQLERSKVTQIPNAYVKKQIDTKNINKWKNGLSKKEIYKLERIAGDVLREQGYTLENDLQNFKVLSPIKELWFEIKVIFRYILRPKSMVMHAQRLEERVIPLRVRLKVGSGRFLRLFFSTDFLQIFRRNPSIFKL